MQWNKDHSVNTEVSQKNSTFAQFQLQEQAL